MERFLRRREVEAVTGLKHSAIYKRISAGRFPRPVRLDGQAVAWLESEIQQWRAARIAERDGPAAPSPDPEPQKRRRGRPRGSRNKLMVQT